MNDNPYPNPFDPAVVSDERWRRYVERYIAERGGHDEVESNDSPTQEAA